MTSVTLTETWDSYVIEAKGHATGSSEVCAAISTLVTMAANWTVANGHEDEQLLESGNARVVIPKDMRGSRTVFNLMIVGFESLERAQKNFVKIEKKVQSLGRI